MNQCRSLSTRALFTSLVALAAACSSETLSNDEEAPSSGSAPAADQAPMTEVGPAGRYGEVRKGFFNTPQGVQELTYELINGEKIFQGDIVLDEEVEPDFRSSGVTARTARWPNAVIPIENDTGNLYRHRRAIYQDGGWLLVGEHAARARPHERPIPRAVPP